MHQEILFPREKTALYPLLAQQIAALAEDSQPLSTLANASALLYEALPDINWVLPLRHVQRQSPKRTADRRELPHPLLSPECRGEFLATLPENQSLSVHGWQCQAMPH